MHLYLPIAGLSVNAAMIVLLGAGVGLLSGMFGVGGGFLTTPLLIFYGIPPTVAVASSATQITGASVSGVLAHMKRGGVDFRMGGVMVAGGIVGSGLGALLFRVLQASGQIDTMIALTYVVLLGGIGGLMARESIGALVRQHRGAARPRHRRHNRVIAALPMRWRFYRSGLYISPIAPFALGMATGVLTVILGVGGGFVMVPAMIYLLGMATGVVLGHLAVPDPVRDGDHHHDPRHHHQGGGYRARHPAAGGIGGGRAARRAARDADEARMAAPRPRTHRSAGRVPHGDRPRLAAGRDLHRSTGMRRARAMAALAIAAPLLAAAAEKPVLVPGVSDSHVEILYSFTGAELLLFGAILYPGGRRPSGGSDIAVVLKGPTEPLIVREKRKIAGMWVNADAARFRSVPGFYAVASSRPLSALVDAKTAAIYELGLASLQLSPSSGELPDAERRFEAGLVDLRRRAGLYREQTSGVEVRDGVLYSARIAIPARVPVGRYTAETFLIRDGHVQAAAVRDIDIGKSGFERFVATAADRWSFSYGLVAVALSLLIGWGAGALLGAADVAIRLLPFALSEVEGPMHTACPCFDCAQHERGRADGAVLAVSGLLRLVR